MHTFFYILLHLFLLLKWNFVILDVQKTKNMKENINFCMEIHILDYSNYVALYLCIHEYKLKIALFPFSNMYCTLCLWTSAVSLSNYHFWKFSGIFPTHLVLLDVLEIRWTRWIIPIFSKCGFAWFQDQMLRIFAWCQKLDQAWRQANFLDTWAWNQVKPDELS